MIERGSAHAMEKSGEQLQAAAATAASALLAGVCADSSSVGLNEIAAGDCPSNCLICAEGCRAGLIFINRDGRAGGAGTAGRAADDRRRRIGKVLVERVERRTSISASVEAIGQERRKAERALGKLENVCF